MVPPDHWDSDQPVTHHDAPLTLKVVDVLHDPDMVIGGLVACQQQWGRVGGLERITGSLGVDHAVD